MLRLFLIFPMSVVVLAFLAFCFGGHCAAWQWWGAVATTVACGFWRRTPREGVRAGLFFIGWLAVTWVGCGLAVAPNWFDESVYHIPAVRMLADGWNPIYVSTPEELLRLTGFAATDFRVDHVLFLPKIVWVFSAVAYFFTNDVLSPLVPILWFLVPSVLMCIWRSMDGTALVWKILVVPLVYCLLFNSAYVVDVVVQLAAIGLLLSFEEVLSGRRIDVLSLVAYSFWMMGAKPPGLLHGGLFWAIFLVFAFIRKVNWRPLAQVVAAVSILLALACATPYLTSIRHYGHPFYPSYSFDETRFPVRNITEDFITGPNEDAASMGFAGRYFYSFVSPSLARAWYRWRLDKPGFQPYSANYGHYPNDGDGTEPIRFGMRVAFWASVAWLLLIGRRSLRPVALMVVLGTAAAPLPLLGYIRYIPWWLLPLLFVYIDMTCGGGRRRRALACLALLGTFAIPPYTLPKKAGYTLKLVDERQRLQEILDGALPPIRPCWGQALAQLKMMRREFPALATAELLPYSAPLADGLRAEDVELPGKLFVFDDANKMRRMASRVPPDVLGRVKYVLYSGFVTLPKAVGTRVASLFDGRKDANGE